MTPSLPAAVLHRQALALLDALLVGSREADRLDVELALVLLAAHPGATRGQWTRVHTRLGDEMDAFAREGEELIRFEQGLRGARGMLRRPFGRARAWRRFHARARTLCARADLLRELQALFEVLEAEHPALASG